MTTPWITLKETCVLPTRHCEAHKPLPLVYIQAPRSEAISQLERHPPSQPNSFTPLITRLPQHIRTIEVASRFHKCASQWRLKGCQSSTNIHEEKIQSLCAPSCAWCLGAKKQCYTLYIDTINLAIPGYNLFKMRRRMLQLMEACLPVYIRKKLKIEV